MKITHYGLCQEIGNAVFIKEAAFFEKQGGLSEPWGKAWEPIHDAETIGDARRKFAKAKGVKLSWIYGDEE